MKTSITRNGKSRPVKNLGWLLANWRIVERFEVLPFRNDSAQGKTAHPDAILVAYCQGGTVYRTEYASATVLRNFLNRPVFRGRDIDWYIHDNGTPRFSVSKEIV